MHEPRFRGIRLWNKGGERWVEAGVVVDASGDADIAALAGAEYEDLNTTGQVQSLSTLFRLANVDVARASETKKADLWALMRDAVEPRICHCRDRRVRGIGRRSRAWSWST